MRTAPLRRRGGERRSRRGLWPRLGIALAAAGIGIGLCEAGLQLLDVPVPPHPLYPGEVEAVIDATVDRSIGWRMPPDAVLVENTEDYTVSYHANPQGFRSPYDFEADKEVRRIVLLGDSYTFGSGVEESETFAALIDSRIEGTAAYNLGIGGFGVDQMWQTLLHYGLGLDPDLVVLSFIRPDLDRSVTSYRQGHVWRAKPTFRLHGGELEPLPADYRPPPLRLLLERRSLLYGLWRRAESSLSRRYAIGTTWRLNRALFAAVRDACREARVPLVIVHIPVNRRHPVPLYERELARLEIDYLDLTPHLPADADALYYPRDRHLNAAGHRFVAARLLEFLDDRGLLR